MRDVDKLKEKIELTLDNRQVVSLVIGSLIVLGVVFVLGVMVGKQSVPPPAAPPPQDVLANLDLKAQLPRAVLVPPPKDPPMTYQETLPGPLSPPPPLKPEPKPQPKPEPKPQSKAEPKPPPKAEQEPEPKAPKAESKTEAKAEPPSPEPDSKPEPDNAPSPTLDKKLADAFATAKAAPHPAEVPAGSPPPAGTYTVQVAASQQKAEVDQVLTKLQGSGLRPYEVDADIPGRGRWYRVRVGSFPTKADAANYLRDLKRETGMSGFVTSAGE